MGRGGGHGGRLVPAEGVHLRLLDDEGLLFEPRSGTAYFLNTAATLIWCRIEGENGVSPGRQAVAAARKADRPAKRYRDIISQWQALGLLVEPGAPPPPVTSAARKMPPPRAGRPAPSVGPEVVRRHYALLDTDIALSFADTALDELVHPTLAHLERAVPVGDPLVIAIDRHGGRFRLIEGGGLVDACRRPSEVAPLVKLHVARLAVDRYPHRLAVHAGALATSAGCLLMPAAAGSGKSVLTAALMAGGWKYLSDDTALLDDRDFAVEGVCYSLTIKRGGWDVVSPLFPELPRQPVHIRPDRQRVRYLPPVMRQADSRPDERKVRWIVSPRFASSGPPAALKPLGRAEALRLVLANCGWVRPLDLETIDRTIAWLDAVESYGLVYSSLSAAVEAIEAMTVKPQAGAGRGL